MTIGNLIHMCKNIDSDFEVMIYDSQRDYDNNTTGWYTAIAYDPKIQNIKISQFDIRKHLVIVVKE